MSIESGTLYVVSTPIGNLGDITQRAIEVLGSVDLIAAEDTRRTKQLLAHFGISTSMISLHDHNELDKAPSILKRIANGETVAVVSDAGTPLISDPGFSMVKLARDMGINVVPVPGACSPIVALSVSGMPTDRFVFEGFLPSKKVAREKVLAQLIKEDRTMIFFESSHRILSSLESMAVVFGEDRLVVVARELTKIYETVKSATVKDLIEWVKDDNNQQKGEFVVVVHGAKVGQSILDANTEETVQVLLDEGLPVKQISTIAAKLTGVKKKVLYDLALSLK